MCGIIGYFGRKDALPILIEGMKKMEYRGYDSAGFCLLDKEKFFYIKKKGKVSELENAIPKNYPKANIGIGHTRWATHGEPSEINAHPHFDCKKEIAVVHNGIVENYSALKELLLKEGHKFVSETDSEVIPHLIEKFYKNDLEKAVVSALKLVEGTYGLAILCKKENKLIAVRQGSPIVVGLGDNETIIASDAVAILPYTKKVMYLNNNEMAVLEKSGCSIKSMDGKKIEKRIDEIKWTVEQMEKRGFKHFMLKEIFEQPRL